MGENQVNHNHLRHQRSILSGKSGRSGYQRFILFPKDFRIKGLEGLGFLRITRIKQNGQIYEICGH
jgi:hypothetical protein